MKRMRVSIGALLVAGVAMLGAPRAEAALVAPGGTALPDPLLFPGGTELDSVQYLNATLGPIEADLYSAVYLSTTGTIDIYYQVTNQSAEEFLQRVTGFDYTGFTTDVYWVTNGSAVACTACTNTGGFFQDGTEVYDLATRNAVGSTVGFNFSGTTVGSNAVEPGETTVLLLVRTNATTYTSGLMSVIDGATLTRPAFSPAIAPEPASMALFGLGLLAAGARLRRRKA